MRGVVYDPKIQDGEVDCPKEGCGGSIVVKRKSKKGSCGRCGTKVHFYRRRKQVVRMTFHGNGNNQKAASQLQNLLP